MTDGLTGRGRRMATAESGRRFRATRPRRGDRSGVDEPRRWRARPLIWILTTLTILAALLFLLWLGWSLYILIHGAPSHYRFDLDHRCTNLSFSCGALSNFATSGLLIAIASAFVLWRLYRLLGRYQARARNESRELVPTAGTILDQVVGRDELCKVLDADLHDRRTRPHVLVGGVGTGKTAVLVRLTEFLADEGAVPVPIRLGQRARAGLREPGAGPLPERGQPVRAQLGRGRDHLAAAPQGREDRRARGRPGGGAHRDQRGAGAGQHHPRRDPQGAQAAPVAGHRLAPA